MLLDKAARSLPIERAWFQLSVPSVPHRSGSICLGALDLLITNYRTGDQTVVGGKCPRVAPVSIGIAPSLAPSVALLLDFGGAKGTSRQESGTANAGLEVSVLGIVLPHAFCA